MKRQIVKNFYGYGYPLAVDEQIMEYLRNNPNWQITHITSAHYTKCAVCVTVVFEYYDIKD